VSLEKLRNVYTYSAMSSLLPDFSLEDESLRQATLAEALKRLPAERDNAGDPILRVVPFDQFEELFSTCPDQWQKRREFFQEVSEALSSDVSLRILFLLREDYLAEFAEFASELSDGGRTRYRLDPLREPQALLAVKKPLEGTSWSFAPEVAESLVRDLTKVKVSRSRGESFEVFGEFVEPVQLQVVCYELLERTEPKGIQITAKALEKFGGVDLALRRFYDRVIKTAVETKLITESNLRKWFQNSLITRAETRNLVVEEQESTGDIPNNVVAVLEREHIVHAEMRSGTRFIELTHDRLIQPILSANQEFRKLEVAAQADRAIGQALGVQYEEPVHSRSGDAAVSPTGGIALCLSGVGYRAMLFNLGSLWRLNDLHYLSKLNRVSSVSGGSITAGLLALNWRKLKFGANGCADNFDEQVTQPIRRLASNSIDLTTIEGASGGVSKRVADYYNKYLYARASLQDLPDEPRFVFNATSLQTGVLWRFSKPYMGDSKVGLVMKPTVELATAIAASSAFPPVLSPCVLSLEPEQFDPNAWAPVTSPDFRSQIALADGGMYDNLGLEGAWKQCKTILVSNGSGTLGLKAVPEPDKISQTNRIIAIIYGELVTSRTRSILDLFKLGVRDGAFWGMGSDIKNYSLPDALACPAQDTSVLAQISTRLTALNDDVQEQLIDWGYATCDAAMRKHVLPDAPAPMQSPYGTFKRP
jgi:NTE family protein